MSRILRAKSSAALIVSVVALVAALGGGAVAGVAVTALNKKEKNEVKRLSKKQARKLDKRIELTPGPKGDRGPRGLDGPTEATTSDPLSPLVAENRRLPDSFTTTQAGRLFVAKPVSLMVGYCNPPDITFDAWLEVDGVEAAGSRVELRDSTGHQGLTFAGVTSTSLIPGRHTAEIAVNCRGGEMVLFGAESAAGMSAIVLGG